MLIEVDALNGMNAVNILFFLYEPTSNEVKFMFWQKYITSNIQSNLMVNFI